MDVQAGWHDSTAHAQGFSHWKREADNCDVIRWCHCHYAYVEVGDYKRRAQTSLRALIWVFGCSTFSYISWESADLSHGYLSASLGVRLQLYREVFFICSSVSAQSYLGHPELVYLSCLWVNQVPCHPVSLRPSIGVARTTIFWWKLAHMG